MKASRVYWHCDFKKFQFFAWPLFWFLISAVQVSIPSTYTGDWYHFVVAEQKPSSAPFSFIDVITPTDAMKDGYVEKVRCAYRRPVLRQFSSPCWKSLAHHSLLLKFDWINLWLPAEVLQARTTPWLHTLPSRTVKENKTAAVAVVVARLFSLLLQSQQDCNLIMQILNFPNSSITKLIIKYTIVEPMNF